MLKATGNGWETERLLGYEVESTLDCAADSFSLEIGMGQKGENAGLIKPGGTVTITDSKGAAIMTGIIDDVDEEDAISIKGRDLMAHAIDQYPDPRRWKTKAPLDILKELAAALPFTGVDVSGVTSSQSAMKAFQVEPGDSYADAFERIGEEGDFEIYVDPLGKLIARNMPDAPAGIAFRFVSKIGEANCDPTLQQTTDDVYSTIKDFAKKSAPTSVTNSTIAKYVTRTLTQRNGDRRDQAGINRGIARQFREALDKMRRWKVTFGGDHSKFGAAPKIGDGVSITSYRHKVTDEPGVVWAVKYKLQKGQGHETEVTVRSRAL